jgi:pimeloyl-ACP methyl ester carboxylesterase
LLLHHLGIERAHIVGHASSAMMALQLALDAPDTSSPSSFRMRRICCMPRTRVAWPRRSQRFSRVTLFRSAD